MALLEFLKRKKEVEKAKKQPEKKSEKILVTPEIKKTGKSNNFSYEVVKEPHISEKASVLAENDKYTFKVYSNTNKLEIKKSVEGIYGVNVLRVNIIKSPKKKRRLGRTEGFKKAFTKAVVTVKAGQKIEIL